MTSGLMPSSAMWVTMERRRSWITHGGMSISRSRRGFILLQPLIDEWPVVENTNSSLGDLAAAMISLASGDSGTTYGFLFLVRVPGSDQLATSLSSSLRLILATSFFRAPVSSMIFNADPNGSPMLSVASQNFLISSAVRTRSREAGALGRFKGEIGDTVICRSSSLSQLKNADRQE